MKKINSNSKKILSFVLTLLLSISTLFTAAPMKAEAASKTNLVVGGVTLDYAAGDYFTDSCYVNIDGKTVNLGAWQCFGFARYCQQKVFGINSYTNRNKFVNCN